MTESDGKNTYVVRSADDLRRLAGLARPARLSVDLPQKSKDESALWQARLANALGICGCTEGAIGLLAGLSLTLILWGIGWFPGPGGWHLLTSCVILASLGAALGRLAGLARARRVIRAEISAMIRWIEAG